jgi:hypothetical protein
VRMACLRRPAGLACNQPPPRSRSSARGLIPSVAALLPCSSLGVNEGSTNVAHLRTAMWPSAYRTSPAACGLNAPAGFAHPDRAASKPPVACTRSWLGLRDGGLRLYGDPPQPAGSGRCDLGLEDPPSTHSRL